MFLWLFLNLWSIFGIVYIFYDASVHNQLCSFFREKTIKSKDTIDDKVKKKKILRSNFVYVLLTFWLIAIIVLSFIVTGFNLSLYFL